MSIRNRFRGTTPVGSWLAGSGAGVKSIQRGTITIVTPALSNTATISSVDTANSRLRILGYSNNNATGAPAASSVRLTFTNATTITATKNNDGGDTAIVSYEVVEYVPGAIKSVQRGTITISGAASNTGAIALVNIAKTELDFLGCQPGDNLDTLMARIALTNATTVTATRTSTAATNTIVAYQVVEWY